MGSLEFPSPDTDDRLAGPIVVGIPWPVPAGLVHAAAELAEALELHLVCAFVDPASYLTEWEPAGKLLAASLDPAANDEAVYPAGEIRKQLETILGSAGSDWSFRVLNGDIGRDPPRGSNCPSAGSVLRPTLKTCPGSVSTA